MSTMYDDVKAVCPYFKSSGKRKITCEGVTDDCNTSLEFESKEKRDEHRKIFCDARFGNCEVYNMLEKKYE